MYIYILGGIDGATLTFTARLVVRKAFFKWFFYIFYFILEITTAGSVILAPHAVNFLCWSYLLIRLHNNADFMQYIITLYRGLHREVHIFIYS